MTDTEVPFMHRPLFTIPPRIVGVLKFWIVSALLLLMLHWQMTGCMRRGMSHGTLSNRARGSSNLQTIGVAIVQYNFRERGDPPDLSAFLESLEYEHTAYDRYGEHMTTEIFVSPGSDLKPAETADPDDVAAHTTYVFAWGIDEEEASMLARGFSFPSVHHQHGVNLLESGGANRWMHDFLWAIQGTNDYLAERRGAR